MYDEKLRKAIAEWAEDEGYDKDYPILYYNHSYDKSIIGFIEVDGVPVALYSLESMIQEYMEDEDLLNEEDGYEQAIEWIEYNTLGAGFSGKGLPRVITNIEEIKERYGE